MAAESPLAVREARCEYARNPVGIAARVPRFSWVYDWKGAQSVPEAKPAGAEVRLAAFRDDLVAGRNLLWMKRTSPQDIFSCLYDGPALAPGVPYWWQVRLALADGSYATEWSEPSRFVVALQSVEDWEGAHWISEPDQKVAWTDFDYQVTFSDVKDAFGVFFRAKDPGEGYMWQINLTGAEPLLRPHVFRNGGLARLLPPVKIGAFDAPKEHVLKIEARGTTIRTVLDGKVIDTRTNATFAAGTIGVRTSTKESARVSAVRVTAPDGRVLLEDHFRGHIMPAFRNPRIVDGQLLTSNDSWLHQGILPKSCPRFRKSFTLASKPIRHAFATACGFGFYELWLNGCKVDPTRVLAPGMSGTDNRALFDTYDVTEQLRAGANTVGFWLAAGYSDDFSRYGWHWLKPKSARLHLAVTYVDGSRDVVTTDDTWTYNPESEIARASIYGGETVDAAKADAAWCTTKGAMAGWRPMTVRGEDWSARLVPNDAPPVRMSDPRRPVRITETKSGVFTVDFGQNRAGFVEVRVKGPKGTKIRLRTSELVGGNGAIDPWTNGIAESTDEFILAGTGAVETFVPRFTYHGFQYVEVTGWPGRPTADDLTAWAVHADVEPTCRFRCSDDTLNKLDNAARWSMLSNFMSYPTDCCMRGERTPCQMDSQAYEDTALLYFNLPRYYAKWLGDIGGGGNGNPDWNGDSTVLPWRLWWNSGDRRFLAAHYGHMQAHVDALARKYPGLVFKDGFGDWCAPNAGQWKDYFNDVEIVNTALFCNMVRGVADAAAVLGRGDDEKVYRALHEKAKTAFQTAFYNAETHAYGDGSQTTAVLPLAFGIVPDAVRRDVVAQLLARINGIDRRRVGTGIYGTRYLGDVLCDVGEGDLLVHLFTQPEYPGFGFMFAQGGTTLWEQWTFKGGMNSHNHAMFSGAAHALVTRLGGLRATAPGFAKMEIAPVFPRCLDFVELARETPRGRVCVEWRRTKEGDVRMNVALPPYAEAAVPKNAVVSRR